MTMSDGMTAKGSRRAVHPPRVAQMLLRISLPRGFQREAILGDFWEDYRYRSWAISGRTIATAGTHSLRGAPVPGTGASFSQ